MYAEEALLPLSALQHLVFCGRQAALIHVEQAWVENVFTVEGKHLHEAVDGGQAESRGDTRIQRSVSLRSLELGLTGKADVVEFRRAGGDARPPGVLVPGWPDLWVPFPVEYKRGKPKRHRADEVQLCAQGLCLEEMLGVSVADGALFYGRTRRRQGVVFDEELRALTRDAAGKLHLLFDSGRTPMAEFGPKCEDCSLIGLCCPTAGTRSASAYLRRMTADAREPAKSRGE
ncbi:MAG: CRISPR-associated protein Cas4 [Thermoanaerobaculia bacterium]